MPNAAIVAAALTDHSAHPYSLFINGLDIIGSAINPVGVPIETIQIDEAGPGGVSSISFVLEDPTIVASIPNGAVIRFHWNTPDVPLFLGWVDTYDYQPAFGGLGRSISIQGIGEEALLDWLVAFDPGTGGPSAALPEYFQWYATLCGVPNARTSGSSGVGTPAVSSQAFPVTGWFRAVGEVQGASRRNLGWTVGVSLRQWLQTWLDQARQGDDPLSWLTNPMSQINVQFTMDFYGGLRVWGVDMNAIPSDYTNLTINDVYAGPIVAGSLKYTVDPSQVVHEVYVNGSAAANSGWFSDGTGIRGQQSYVSDTTNITSPDLARQAAQAIFDANSNQVRGSFELEDFTPAATIHVGSFVTITDASVSLTAQSYRIMEIEKTFNGSGRQNWTVTFGSLKPSVTRYTRQLTRTIRS